MSGCLRLTDKNFKQEVLDSELPVLVDFWGSWCPPCKMVEPVVEQLAKQLDGIIKVGKLNIDQNPATCSTFGISAAPTFVLFNQGKLLERIIGARAKIQLLQIIDMNLFNTVTKSESKPTEASEKKNSR